jgi:hypothetical protein
VVSLALPPGVVTVWPYRVKPFFCVCVCGGGSQPMWLRVLNYNALGMLFPRFFLLGISGWLVAELV